MSRLIHLSIWLAAAWVSVAAWAAPAEAGTYDVTTCAAAYGDVNHSWAYATNDSAHFTSGTVCPGFATGGDEQGLWADDALNLSSGPGGGASSNWTFTAPPGTVITRLRYDRSAGKVDDNAWVPGLWIDGSLDPNETCSIPGSGLSCSFGDSSTGGSSFADIGGLAAHSLTFGVLCTAGPGTQCATGASAHHDVFSEIFGATVSLSDPNPPAIAQPSGALWGPGAAGGYHKATESLTVSATDGQSGVARIVGLVDGSPRAWIGAACDFSYAVPCPASTGVPTLSLDTTRLPDGPHSLTVHALDGAQNPSADQTHAFVVDNTPPAPPTSLQATEGGSSPPSSTFYVTAGLPGGQVAPITVAHYAVCDGAGTGCAPAQDAPVSSATSVALPAITVPGGVDRRLKVWLGDGAGNSDPARVATIALVPGAPGPARATGGARRRALTVRARVVGRRLVVTATAGRGARGRLTLRYREWRGGHLIASGHALVRLRAGRSHRAFRVRRLDGEVTFVVIARRRVGRHRERARVTVSLLVGARHPVTPIPRRRARGQRGRLR